MPQNSPFSQHEIDLLTLKYKDLTIKELSQLLNKTPQQIYNKAHKLKLKKDSRQLGLKLDGNLRRCAICQIVYPQTREFFHHKIKRANTFRSNCKKCIPAYIQKGYNKRYGGEMTLEKMVEFKRRTTAKRCQKLNRQCTITLPELLEIYKSQNGVCFYTHKPMVFHNKDDDSLSIDRLDSSKGYTKDNVVLCRWIINRVKNDLSKEDFIGTCKLIASIF